MFLLSLLTFWIISKVFKALSEGHWTSVSSTHEKKLDARFMLWETLILNWAGKGAKGLPRCRPKFLPGSGSSEAAPERSRCGRRSEGSIKFSDFFNLHKKSVFTNVTYRTP